MVDVVDAAVPSEWLQHFIGHEVWAKPIGASNIEPATWYRLVDVYIDPSMETWCGRRMTIDVGGEYKDAYMAKTSYVRGLPASECQHMPHIAAGWWEWTTPFDDPPEIPTRQGAKPAPPPTTQEPKEPAVWETYALFNL